MSNIFSVYKIKYFFIPVLLTGFIATCITKNILANSYYQSGPETIGLFFPPLLCTLFMYFTGKEYGFNKKIIASTLLLFFLTYLPFGMLLLKEVKPVPGDDFDFYFKYAQNMVTNKTLWGGDQIRFPNESKTYITQPGYRYFVALELLIFQKLYRFVSILNIGFFIFTIGFFFKIINLLSNNRKLKIMLSSLIILSVPYATKNILMGLPEWLTIILLIYFSWFYFVKKQPVIAFIVLAFIPFLRQNLLPPVIMALLIHCITQNMNYKIILYFILILLLPVYHNLYYAGELRFFTSIFKWPFLDYDGINSTGFKYFQIVNNLLHYAGLDINDHRLDFIEEGFLMLIGFVLIFFSLRKYLPNHSMRRWFYTVTLLTLILPGLLLGTDFYPRFEFVVIYFTIVLFLQFKTIHTTAHQPSR